MADSQTRPPHVAVTAANKVVGGIASPFATPLNYTSISALRTRLAAANASYYTAAKLDSLTVNDMVFALRSIDDRGTISDYQPVSTA